MNKFLVLLAFFGLSVSTAFAETANQLKTTIETFVHGGAGALSALVTGNTVTVTGNITGATKTLSLNIDPNVTVVWKADYTGTANFPDVVISLSNTGAFEVVDGGHIRNNGDSFAIQNDVSNSKIIVSGGTVGGIYSRGNVTVSGGTVNTEKNISALDVYGDSSSTVTVSGGVISSKRQAINAYNSCNVVISGGVLTGDGFGYGDEIIIIDEENTLTVSGGMILAKKGYAINSISEGKLTISGGVGFAYGTSVTDVINGTFTENSGVLVAWNRAAGTTTYKAGASDDIFILPATSTAVWAKQGGSAGILGTITGFIPVEGVTVED